MPEDGRQERRLSREMRRALQERSHAWGDVGIARLLSREAVKRAWIQTVVLVPFAVGILLLYGPRRQLLPGPRRRVEAVTVFALLVAGWGLARSAGRVLGR